MGTIIYPTVISNKKKRKLRKPGKPGFFCFVKNIYCKIENIVYNRAIKIRKEKPVAKNLKLKMARVEHDMTQGDLADAIGVTRQTIGLIEAGKYNPTLSLCLAICKTLDKTLDQLFWE